MEITSRGSGLSRFAPHMLAVARIVFAALFVLHGTQKLFGFPAGMQPVPLESQLGIGALIEVVGGLFLLLGFLTRPTAFVLAGQMAVAYFQFHAPNGLFPAVNKGESAVLFCFLFLYLVFAGAGAWSLDALLGKERKSTGRTVPAVGVSATN